MFSGDVWLSAAGFSNPLDSSFLELRQLLRVEACPIEGADVGCGPMLAKTIGALDRTELGVSTGSDPVGA